MLKLRLLSYICGMKVGQTIKHLRKEKGINQKEFAKSIGMSTTYLSQVEKHDKGVKHSTMERISKALGVPIPAIQLLALEESDVHDSKVDSFRVLKPIIDQMLEGLLIDK